MDNFDQKPPVAGDVEQKEKLPFRIIIAEDEPLIRRLFDAFLKLKYSHVEVVENGDELMAKLTQPGVSYDCVVSDDNMPGRQGMKVLEELKDTVFKNTAFVLVTGRIDMNVKNQVTEMGGFYLNKPLTGDLLRETVEKAIKAKQPNEPGQK